MTTESVSAAAVWAPAWAAAVGEALLGFLWQGALVSGALWLALGGLRRSTPRVRYGWSCLALFSLPVWFVTTVVWVHAHPQMGWAAAAGGVWGWREGWPAWVAVAWAVSVALMVVYTLGGWMLIQRTRRQAERSVPQEWVQRLERLRKAMALPVRPGLALSAQVLSPCVVGCWRPLILLPMSAMSGVSPEQLEALLAHELAHILRCDYLVNLGQRAVEVLFFFHPAVWWISRQVEQEREQCCDDLAIAACGDRLGYARALVEMAAACANARERQWACAASGGSLRDRISRIAGLPLAPSGGGGRMLQMGGVLAIAGVLGGLLATGAAVPNRSNTTAQTAAEKVLTAAAALPGTARLIPPPPIAVPGPRLGLGHAAPVGGAEASSAVASVESPAAAWRGPERQKADLGGARATGAKGGEPDDAPTTARNEASGEQPVVVAFSFAAAGISRLPALESCTAVFVVIRQVEPSGAERIALQPELQCSPVAEPTRVLILTM